MPLPHGQILKNYIEQKGTTIEAFRKKLGVSRQTVYNYFEKRWFDDVLITELAAAGVENAKNLFTRDISSEDFVQITERLPAKAERGVPYLGDLDIFAGVEDIAHADISEYITDYIFIPGFKEAKYYVNVRGNSMYSKYCAGDIIAIRQVKNMNEIQYGQVYVVITDDNRVLKYVRKGKDDKHLKLVSENPKFDDMEVERKRVRAMFLVLGKITKDVL